VNVVVLAGTVDEAIDATLAEISGARCSKRRGS
jgi:hypothetical protein